MGEIQQGLGLWIYSGNHLADNSDSNIRDHGLDRKAFAVRSVVWVEYFAEKRHCKIFKNCIVK